jgi:radical SAM protein with 4Fe4S-binding SPASM domain
MGLIATCRDFANLTAAKRQFDRRKSSHVLRYLFWECTLGCNLSCRHCGSRCSPDVPRDADLPGDEVKRIFREIAEDFDASKITLAVTGGEPLTRPDLFDVMADVGRLGFWWGIVTNGVLVTDAVVARMRATGMKTVAVSIDGDAEAHAALRGSVRAYERAMAGLQRLIKRGGFLDCVEVVTVVYSGNVDRLEAMYDRFHGLGVGRWRLLAIDPIGRMKDPANQHLLLSGEQLGRLLEFIAARRQSGPMPITYEESGFLGLKYEKRVRDEYFYCPAGIEIASILHDGAISACPSLERRLIQGDARSERFSEVWEHRFQPFRDRRFTHGNAPCLGCKWWKHCEGGSLHLWDWDLQKPHGCAYLALKQAGCL